MDVYIGLHRNEFAHKEGTSIDNGFPLVEFLPHEREKSLLNQIGELLNLQGSSRPIVIPNIELMIPIQKAGPVLKALEQIEKDFKVKIIITFFYYIFIMVFPSVFIKRII